MEKKNKGGLIVVIILLVIVVLGLVGYIAYDKGLIFNNDKEIEEIEEKEDYNYTEISSLINEKLSVYFALEAYNKNGVNLLSISDSRLRLVDYLLMPVAQDIYEGQSKSINYEKYSSKYNELYGTNYSLETDLLYASSGAVAAKKENNITWNATLGTSGLKYNLTAQKITNNDDLYTLTGTYTRTDESDNSVTPGTFEIKYIRINNTNSLQSIILTDK